MKTISLLCTTLIALAVVRPSRADDGSVEARDSYKRGKVAYDSGDFATAAHAFADADSLAPNARVLETAMAAAERADDPTFGMELVERADARGLTAAANAGRDLFGARTGQVIVVCAEASTCSAKMDGVLLPDKRAKWVTVGDHAVQLETDGVVESLNVTVENGRLTEIKSAHRPAPAPPPTSPSFDAAILGSSNSSSVEAIRTERARLHPAWFWTAASATALLGVASAISGGDTLRLHGQLAESPRDADIADRGRAAETRTNVLLISTGVVALATVAVGYFVFRPKEVRHGIAFAR